MIKVQLKPLSLTENVKRFVFRKEEVHRFKLDTF